MKKRRTVSALMREKILSEAEMPGVTISEVAAKYKIRKGLLYRWRSARSKDNVRKSAKLAKRENDSTPADFIELRINQDEPKSTTSQYSKKLLKRLILEFDDISLSIDGNINSGKVMDLIRILEG